MANSASDSFGDRLTWFPHYDTTYGTFDGPDPWANGRNTTWNINLYHLGRAWGQNDKSYTRVQRPENLPAMGTIGIGTAGAESYHMLPVFLCEMWVQGRVKDEDLPALIHQIEGPLKLRHYASWWRFMLNGLRWAFAISGILVAAVGIVILSLSDRTSLGLAVLGSALGLQLLGPVQWFLMRRLERRLAREITP